MLRGSISDNDMRLVETAIIKVGGGRGFLMDTAQGRLVLTAAHCLPNLPPPMPASYTEERTYANLLGTLDAVGATVWAECAFVNPVADVAVLGEPDGQSLSEENDAYHALVDSRVALSLGTIGRSASGLLLARDGHWRQAKVHRSGALALTDGGAFLSLDSDAEATMPGCSGSPILTLGGAVVGIVSLGTRLNPLLSDHLPGWLLRELSAFSRRSPRH